GGKTVTRVGYQMKLRAGNPLREKFRVARGDQHILRSGDHQRRCLDIRQPVPGLERVGSLELPLKRERRGLMLEQPPDASLEPVAIVSDVLRRQRQRPAAPNDVLWRNTLTGCGQHLERLGRRGNRVRPARSGASKGEATGATWMPQRK